MLTHAPLRRTTGAVAALAAALLLAGCGNAKAPSGGGVVKSDDASPSASATPTKDAGSGAGTLTADTLFAKTYDAAIKAGSAHMVMNSSGGQSFQATGDVTYTKGAPTMQMKMTGLQGAGGGGAIEMRYVGNILYMQIPGMTPAGKFLAIDPKDSSSPMGKSFGQLTGQLDPLKSLQALKGAVKSFRATGQDTIGGEETSKYHVVVDSKKALSKMSQSMPPEAAAQMPPTFEYDIWLDSQDRMRQMEFALMGTKLHMELTDWGKPVKVAKPAPGQIIQSPKA